MPAVSVSSSSRIAARAAVGVALRRADRHPRRRRDLLEREAERILQDEDAGLGVREAPPGRRGGRPGAPRARPRGRACARGATRDVLVERVVAPRAAPRGNVAARVEREPVQPRRERGLAAELADLHAQLGERVLGCISRVLGIREHVGGEPRRRAARGARTAPRVRACLRPWRVVTRIGIAQSVVGELGLGPQRGTDSTARAQRGLHRASLLAGPGRAPRLRAPEHARLPAASRATTTIVLTLRIPLSGRYPRPAACSRRSDAVDANASPPPPRRPRSAAGRGASLITGGCTSSRNGRETVAVPTASVTSTTAV